MKAFGKVLATLGLAAFAGSAMVACGSNSSGGSDNNGGGGTVQVPGGSGGGGVASDVVPVVDISQLNNGSSRDYHMASAQLSFAQKTTIDDSNREAKVFQVVNNSTGTVSYTITNGNAASFVVDATECGATTAAPTGAGATLTLAAKSSCDIRVEFGRGSATTYNGDIRGAIIFAAPVVAGTPPFGQSTQASQNEVSLQMMGSLNILNNTPPPQSDDNGHTQIGLALSAPFTTTSNAVQTVTITNTGTDKIYDLSYMTIVGGSNMNQYSIFASNCPSTLVENASCTVQVLYLGYMTQQSQTPTSGRLQADSSMSDKYSIGLTSANDVTDDGN